MPDSIKNRALYSTCVTVLAFTGLAIAVTATILPLWGYFTNPAAPTTGSAYPDRGHFGPWQTCKDSIYGKPNCRDGVSKFQPVAAVRMSGYFAVAGVMLVGMLCVLNVLHLAMIVSKDKIMLKFKNAVMAKLVVSVVSEIVSIVVGVLFAFQTDDKENSYHVTRGESFYLQIGLIVINFLLFIASLYDLIFLRTNPVGDPTTVRDPSGVEATTFNNPGYRDKKKQGHTISMTDASGKPYLSIRGANGSTASVSTMVSTNGSSSMSCPRNPLRSSLKKPKVSTDPGLGISNPGFSRSSPPLEKKKVRIQTQSTDV